MVSRVPVTLGNANRWLSVIHPKTGPVGSTTQRGPTHGAQAKTMTISSHNQLAPTKTGLMMKRSINFWRSFAGAPLFLGHTHSDFSQASTRPGDSTLRRKSRHKSSRRPDSPTMAQESWAWSKKRVGFPHGSSTTVESCKVGEKSSTLIGFLEYVCCA